MNSYDYRNSNPIHYKSQNLEPMMTNIAQTNMHQANPNHQIYYENQNISQLDQSSYLNMNNPMGPMNPMNNMGNMNPINNNSNNMGMGLIPTSVSGVDPNFDYQRYYWR